MFAVLVNNMNMFGFNSTCLMVIRWYFCKCLILYVSLSSCNLPFCERMTMDLDHLQKVPWPTPWPLFEFSPRPQLAKSKVPLLLCSGMLTAEDHTSAVWSKNAGVYCANCDMKLIRSPSIIQSGVTIIRTP